MSSRRPAARPLHALPAGLGVAVLAAAALPSAAPAAGGASSGAEVAARAAGPITCKLKPRQRRTASFRVAHSILTRYRDPETGNTARGEFSEEETRVFGRVRIMADTCRRQGRWSVPGTIAVNASSVGLDPSGEPVGGKYVKGWGIGVREFRTGLRERRIRVNVFYCKKSDTFGTLKLLNDVPLPFIDYSWDVAKFVVGQFIPEDKVRCGDVGVSTLRISASSNGRLRVRPTGTLNRETEELKREGGFMIDKTRFWVPRRPRVR